MSYNLCYGINTQVKSSNVSYNNSSVASYNLSYATNNQPINSSNVSYDNNTPVVNSNNTNYSGCYSLTEALKRANTIVRNDNQPIGIKTLKNMLLERIKNRLLRHRIKI